MLSDTLTSIGQPLCDAKFTEYVLAGLDSDYEPRRDGEQPRQPDATA
jgi:hypothetical protein